jgi:membrane protein
LQIYTAKDLSDGMATPSNRLWLFLKTTALQWHADKAPRLGAALAFYSALSIGPLLVIAVALAGAIFGEEAARGELIAQMKSLVGVQGAQAIQLILANSRKPADNLLAASIGALTLLFSASGVFGELQDAMNTIWNVPPSSQGWLSLFKDRFLSFSMVLGIGFLLMVSLVVTALISALSDYYAGRVELFSSLLPAIDFVVTFGVIAMLFALIFKILPDTPIAWKDVMPGALATGVLFAIGKYAIGFYLGHSAIASTYGAAGSLMVLVIWIYYSAQILYFGAEMTRAYAEIFGSRKKPAGMAV